MGETDNEARRVFLVVVDDSEEMQVALKFAALRAQNSGGRVALFYVIEPVEFQHWMFVGSLMQEEAREDAERAVHKFSDQVQAITGEIPMVFIREGRREEQLLKLIKEEPVISLLVLGAADSSDGPGPLVSSLTTRLAGSLRIPFTIVPEHLSDTELERIT